MNLNALSLAQRMSLAFGLITALLLATVAAAGWQITRLHAASTEVATNWLPSVEHVNQMDTGLTALRMSEFQHVANTDDAKMGQIEKRITEVLAEIETDRLAYVALISSPEEQALYKEFEGAWRRYLGVHEKTLEASRRNDNEAARQLLEGDAQALHVAASKALGSLVDLNHTGALKATAEAQATYEQALSVLAAAAVAAVLLSAFTAFRLIRAITVPLREAVAVAERVAAGDLSQHINQQRSDETGQLLAALQRMQDSLSHTVGSVRGNAESVATASAQIAQGNTDLSQRTEEQASALQQTAATMEELGTTVRHNADNAQQASRLATDASGVASQGGEVVGRVVATMKSINDSSRKISDIISVIDGIAFQTNILALNAAVEAARAGEQGRGFAVVAAEVRNLAQRSAEAAKEIKTLITTSVEQVEHGTALVDQAGATMGDIVRAIEGVRHVVSEISEASAEQSSGVSQVGQAVTQMDQATQQNAALVEESAAAAESLKQQATLLVQAVAAFRLVGAAAGASGFASAGAASQGRPSAAQRSTVAPRPAAALVPARGVVRPPKPAAAPSDTSTAAASAEWETF